MDNTELVQFDSEFGVLEVNSSKITIPQNIEYHWVFSRNGEVLLERKCGGLTLTLVSEHVSSQRAEQFFFSILLNLQRTLSLTNQYKNNAQTLLKFFLEQGKPALDIAEDNPGLAFLAACHQFITNEEKQKLIVAGVFSGMEELLKEPRRKIALTFGLPREEWVVRLTSKIPSAECSTLLFRGLLELLRKHSENISKELSPDELYHKKICKILRHLPVINSLVVEVLAVDRLVDLCSFSFFRGLCRVEDMMEKKDVLSALSELQKFLGNRILLKLFGIPKLTSIDELYHSLYSFYEYSKKIDSEFVFETVEFCSPPVPELVFDVWGKKYGIYPIRNGVQLVAEAASMEHCIDTYVDTIIEAKGELYCYHVHLPQSCEATVLIRKNQDVFVIEELNGVENREVSKNVEKTVQHWLDKWNNETLHYAFLERRSLQQSPHRTLPEHDENKYQNSSVMK